LSQAWYAAAVSAECSLGRTAYVRTELERIMLLGKYVWESFAYIRKSVLFTVAKDF